VAHGEQPWGKREVNNVASPGRGDIITMDHNDSDVATSVADALHNPTAGEPV
jgi:hypothetical protein